MNGALITQIREACRESQVAFAVRFEVHQCTISRWESDGIDGSMIGDRRDIAYRSAVIKQLKALARRVGMSIPPAA